jgi:hypothetical protein
MAHFNSAILGLLLVALSAASGCSVQHTPSREDASSQRVAPPIDDADYPPLLVAEKIPSTPTAAQKKWALALGAVLNKVNGDELDVLGGGERTEEAQEFDRDLLARGWKIRTRQDLLDTLTWLEKGGHRRSFDELATLLADPEQLRQAESSKDPAFRDRVSMAKRMRGQPTGQSIGAWDFGRYVNLCGWGYEVGFLSEDEAWQKIMPVARAMQATYPSWNEYGNSYHLGRVFWSDDAPTEARDRVNQAIVQLSLDANSPWQQIPWDLDLAPARRGSSKRASH